MKRLFALAALITLLGFSGIAHATLVDNGGNMIYDTDLNITWYDTPHDTGYAAMNWNDAMGWANNLTLGGVSGWRLPATPGTTFGYDVTGGEMGHLYYVEMGNVGYNAGGGLVNRSFFSNITAINFEKYWYSTEFNNYQPNNEYPYSWSFIFQVGYETVYTKGTLNNVLAVHEGNYGPSGLIVPEAVPEPATMVLFGLGGIGMAFINKKRKAK